MKSHTLDATARTTYGRKVKKLRSEGLLPATVYGKKVKSISVSVSTEAFEKVFQAAGETGLVELSVAGEKRPVLVHTVQRDPVKGQILHVEFHQVDLKEKVTAKVPVAFTGDAPAVVNKVGVLLTILDEIEVEALPTDLPERLTVDVSKLAEVDQEITVGDVSIPTGVTFLTAKDQSVVRVGPLISKEAEAQAAAEEAAAKAAAEEKEKAAATAAEAPAAAAETKEQPKEEAPAPQAPPQTGEKKAS